MPVPATDLPAPIAVLVLAWDEATPAVRALVEATQAPAPTVDSILVMVPQADAPDHLSAEEYLPLPAPADYAALVEAEPATPPPADVPEVAPSPTTAPAGLPSVTNAPFQVPTSGSDAANLSLLAPELSASPAPEFEAATSATEPAAALGWAAVRVLRLGNHSLSQLAQRAGQPLPAPIWTGAAQLPAAPYLGATAPATAPGAPSPTALGAFAESGFSPSLIPGAAALASEAASATSSHPAVAPEPLATAARADFYEPAEPQPQAALETDLPLSEEEEIEVLEPGSPDDLLSEEPVLPPSAAQAGWPEALTSLRQPATLAEPAQTEPLPDLPPAAASPAPAALQPATHYPAPNLNFQVIQYARFAVPVALAEADFAVLYAPAWPTWLAAQELRQRTGRPLVLHVATLAAADDEPVGTATGWMAELQRQALQRADLILTETPALAARIRHELGLPAGLVLAIAVADAAAIAQALHTARPRPVAERS